MTAKVVHLKRANYYPQLYIVDQPARARSAWLHGVDSDQKSIDVAYTEQYFTASERSNLWPQAHLHTQWPGNGSFGDPVFDEFYKALHPFIPDFGEQSALVASAGKALLDKIGVRHYDSQTTENG